MRASKNFLERCEALRQAGFRPDFEIGACVARGFADLGFETFLFLTDTQMVSLYSGQVSVFPQEHADHFFALPTCDQLVDQIQRQCCDVDTLTFVEQREWLLEMRDVKTNERLECRAATLEDVLADSLLVCLRRAG